MRHLFRALLLSLAAVSPGPGLVAVASAAGPTRAQAPGRVVFSVTGGGVGSGLDGPTATAAVALPNGGAVLIGGAANPSGFYAAQLQGDGTLDQSFGVGGIAHIVIATAPFLVDQVVRQPDGRLVVLGFGPGPKADLPHQVLVRLNPDGSLDQTFGSGGVQLLATESFCVVCAPELALLPSGEFVITGAIGQSLATANPVPNRWVVARLTSTGALDPGFGDSGIGIVVLPVTGAQGFRIAVLENGDILTLGIAGLGPGGGEYLARLLPSGALDPSFNGGAPTMLPAGAGLEMLASPDGKVVVGLNGALLRYNAVGLPDPTFGSGGVAPIVASGQSYQLLPALGDDGAVVVSQSNRGEVQAQQIAADGTATSPVSVSIGFGGGEFSTLDGSGGGRRPLSLPPLEQDTFQHGFVVRRSDASFLIVGGVALRPSSGAGAGGSGFDFAAAALTPSLALDTSFGGAATPLHAALRVPTQRAATARSRHSIRVKLDLSAPGLCFVVITAHNQIVAQALLPAFAAGPATLPVELTPYGDQWLRHHRHVTLSVGAQARDLLTNTATVTAAGALR